MLHSFYNYLSSSFSYFLCKTMLVSLIFKLKPSGISVWKQMWFKWPGFIQLHSCSVFITMSVKELIAIMILLYYVFVVELVQWSEGQADGYWVGKRSSSIRAAAKRPPGITWRHQDTWGQVSEEICLITRITKYRRRGEKWPLHPVWNLQCPCRRLSKIFCQV